MIKEFRYLADFPDNFIKQMMTINDSMLEVLYALDDGEFRKENTSFTVSDLSYYVKSLINKQRESLGRTKPGSWGLVANDDEMDADARVEFIFKPTYIATATLTRFVIEYPETEIYDSEYKEVLRKGMIFCTHRDLGGHGYEFDKGQIEALTILSLGKVPLFLYKYPNFCPKLRRVINNVANSMALRLENASAYGMWGEDYSLGFRSALETLYLQNNKEFMESIEESQNDDTTIGREELSW